VALILLIHVTSESYSETPPATWIDLDTTQCVNWIVVESIWSLSTDVLSRANFKYRLELLVDGEVKPNTREHLFSWIRDPQQSKPGNQMPPNPLASGDSDALLAYLSTLR